MNARELINEACDQINTYRHPNIDDAAELLDKILTAAGLGSLKHDQIESISEYGGDINIETSWSARGCAQTSSYKFPASFLDLADPIKAATVWGLQKQINDTRIERDRYATYAKTYGEKLVVLEAELTRAQQ